jgi:hypothetical protein
MNEDGQTPSPAVFEDYLATLLLERIRFGAIIKPLTAAATKQDSIKKDLQS